MNNKEEKHKDNFIPEILGVIIGTGALILWYFSSLAIEKVIAPSSFQNIVTICGAAFGAFFGAYCAFKLRQHEENQNKKNKRKTAIDLCLFTMARQHNAISLIKILYDKYPSEFLRAFQMPAMKPPEYKDLKVNLDELIFLSNQDNIEFLFHLSIEQERFHQAIHAVTLRNEYSLDQLQPAVAKYQIGGASISKQDLRTLLGTQIFHTSINLANTAYDHLCATQSSILKMQHQLHNIAKSIYPEEAFMKISDPILNPTTEPPNARAD
jgi:hypothetical protein